MKALVRKAMLDNEDFVKKIQETQKYARDNKKKLDQKYVLELEFNKILADQKVKELKSLLRNKDLDRARRLILEIDLNRAKKQATEANAILNNYLNTGDEKLSRFRSAFSSIWKSILSVGQSIGLGFAALVKTGIDKAISFIGRIRNMAINFESDFAGVKKTIESTAGGFQWLKKELKDLTTEIPLSFEEISKIAELWWQLGIAKKDIKEFTKVVANLRTSTNLSTEAAATSLARIANVFQLSSKEYEKLGNVIVQLGNNFATTESEIVDFSTYLMASARTAGFTADEVFAIGATLSSVGIKAEAGGSAFSKAISVINTAVATGDKTVKDFARVAGMSAEEFAKQWREKPAEAFTKFVEWLGNEWALAIPIIQDLLGKNIRLQNGMLATANAGNLLRQSLEMAHEEYTNGNALQTEADKRYETARSEIQMLDNELDNMSETLGKKTIPAMVWWKKVLVEVHGWINNLFGATDVFSEYLGELTDMITENQDEMKKLSEQYKNGEISKDDYINWLKKLQHEQNNLRSSYDKEIEALKNEEDAMKKSQEWLKRATEEKKKYLEKIEELKIKLDEEREKYGENLQGLWTLSWQYKATQWLLDRSIDLEKKYTDEIVSNTVKQQERIRWLRDVEKMNKKATDAQERHNIQLQNFNAIKIDDSTTRSEFDKSKNAALNAAKAYETALNAKIAYLTGGKGIQFSIAKTKWISWLYVQKIDPKFEEALAVWKAKTEVSKQIKDLELSEFKWTNDWYRPTWGGSGSKKDPIKRKKEELKKLRDLSIEEVQQSQKSEKEKYSSILEINENYKKKLAELEGKSADEIVKKAEESAKKEEKIIKDKYQGINRALDKSKDHLKGYGKEVEALEKKWKNTLKWVKDELRNFNNDLKELDKDYYKDMGERYAKVKEELNKDNLDEEERNKLQEELNFLMEKTTEEQRKQAEEAAKLSEAQKREIEYNKQKLALQEKISIAKAFSSQKDFSEKKIDISENEDGSLKASYTDEKWEIQQVTEYKNIQYLADLANKQAVMAKEMDDLKNKIETEFKVHEDLNKKKTELEKNQTEILKEEIEKRKQEVSDYVDHYEKEWNRQVEIAKRIAQEMKAAAAEYLAAKASMGQWWGTTVNNNGGNTTNNTYNINNPSDASMAVFKSMNDRATPL